MSRAFRTLAISTALALIASVFVLAAPAFAQTTCTVTTVTPASGGTYDVLNIDMTADQTNAMRIVGGFIEVAEDVNAGATDFVTNIVAACTTAVGAVDAIDVDGTNAGVETFKVIEAGTAADDDFGDEITNVDLGAGADTLEIMTADDNNDGVADPSPNLFVALGTSATGQTVADQGFTAGGQTTCLDDAVGPEVNGGAFDCADLVVADTTINLRVTGGTDSAGGDSIDAQGDFDTGLVDADGGGDLDAEEANAPGTAGNNGLGAGGADNEPNGGNLDAPLVANLGPGNDLIAAGDGNDVIAGAEGFDFVEYNEAGAAIQADLQAGTVAGGSGTDTITNFQDITGSVFDDNILGSDLDNSIFANCGDDFIDGRAQDDVEVGDGGPVIGPFLCNGTFPEGNDTFYQGAAANGADDIFGNDEDPDLPNVNNDEIGLDTVDYGDRTTDLYLDATGAGSGAGGCAPPAPLATCEGDTLTGVEHFIAGTGNDIFAGSGSEETFTGGAGNDFMSGGGAEDYFDFQDSPAAVAVDVPLGTATGHGSDTFDSTVEGFNGSEFNDSFLDLTTQDNDYLGNGGDDLFDQNVSPSADADYFEGGDGVDTLDYSKRTNDLYVCLDGEGIVLSCAFGTPAVNGEGLETDTVGDDIENANGGSGDDVMEGNERDNVLTGNLGNDSTFGFAGNDTFPQGAAPDGADSMSGGTGADFVDYSLRTGNVRVSLGTGAGNNGEGCVPGAGTGACEGDSVGGVENASTGAGNDLLIGSDDDNILTAGAGRDLVNPAGGADILDGGDGNDRVSFATGVGVKVNLGNGTAAEIGAGGAGGLDTLGNFENVTGSLKADILAGDAGANKMAGLAGGDIIRGKKGKDKLKGAQGKDFLHGGKGKDKGNGGPGRDTCRKIEKRRSCER